VSAPEHYARVKTVFLGARALPSGERTRFLAAQCGADAALEAKVRRMLTLEERDADFLSTPALAELPAALGPGSRFAHFRIFRTLGEGGMGVVYEAEQDEPARRVALKLIRAGGFSQRLRSRFRHEIRVLGQLRHPGIAQIYEAGTHEVAGQTIPYFAMELVEGRPLLQCAAELDLRSRLALLAQVCDAVHHAHQKGVIHRDLKPGNILVETAPARDAPDSRTGTALPWRVKVLDFGVARLAPEDSSATLATQAGQLIGTLAYMSPEQAAGDPAAMDVRSDIYSIGVIACELLAGRPPYALEGKPLPEAVRIIADEPPLRLGTVERGLRGDIETIVAKALE
jgi:serine/threonine protein kinase